MTRSIMVVAVGISQADLPPHTHTVPIVEANVEALRKLHVVAEHQLHLPETSPRCLFSTACFVWGSYYVTVRQQHRRNTMDTICSAGCNLFQTGQLEQSSHTCNKLVVSCNLPYAFVPACKQLQKNQQGRKKKGLPYCAACTQLAQFQVLVLKALEDVYQFWPIFVFAETEEGMYNPMCNYGN